MTHLYLDAVQKKNTNRPPVWFMRQAGRYHSHYQKLRANFSFMDLCKRPELACEVTLGPIHDFDFDAAIMFSDLLFPLEVMGMGLRYEPGPKLDWHLKSMLDMDRLKGGEQLAQDLQFQGEAVSLIRKLLPPEKALLGFVGGPLTLFFYAAEGSHKGELSSAKEGLHDRRFGAFCERLIDLLAENMALQARAGADAVAMLDTCAGEISAAEFRADAVPAIRAVLERFKQKCPDTPVLYYSKNTGPEYWNSLKGLPIDCLGIDWKHDIAQVLSRHHQDWAIQGNIDPNWMLNDPTDVLELKLRKIFTAVKTLPAEQRRGWVCGLGHGVLPKTPEENVRMFLRVQKEMFGTD